MHLTFDPPFMPLHTALLAIAAAGGILWLYVRREMRGSTSRAGAVGGYPAGEGGQALLVSDGRDTADSFPLDAARAARAQGFTVSTLCVGKQTQQRDLQVVARKTQVFAAPGQAVQLGAEIRDT